MGAVDLVIARLSAFVRCDSMDVMDVMDVMDSQAGSAERVRLFSGPKPKATKPLIRFPDGTIIFTGENI